MAIVPNRAYNNPALGQAFNNIAAMFGPPDSGELVNYAQARGLNQTNDIIEQLRADPRYQGADAGVLANLFDPTSSWTALEMGDATDRRGQDITAQTSITNNQANNRTDFLKGAFGDLSQGAVRPAVPEDITSLFGVDTALPAVAGTPKPLTETEWDAAQKARLLASGALGDDDIIAELLGQVPVENVVGEGGVPEIVRRPDAVGRQPYFNKGAEAKPENAIALLPDGRRVPAVQADNNVWLHAQTGEPLPVDIQVFKLPQAQGSASDVGLGPTTANQTSANNRRAEVTRALNLLDLYEGVIRNDPSAIGMAGAIKGVAQNAIAVTQDLASAFGSTVPELEQFKGELQSGLQAVAPEMFNPSIPEAEFYQGALAYALARTENPSGEVSRQAYERAYERVVGGALRNSQSASSAVGAFRKMLETELSAIKTLDDPSMARTDTTYTGTAAEGVAPGWDPEDWKYLTPEEQQQVLGGQ